MDAVDSKASGLSPRASDLRLIRRLTLFALYVVCFTAAFATLFRYFTRRFEDFTGPARWIWAQHQISRNVPVFFVATRDFTLPPGWRYAHVKVSGDPEYTMWFNGRQIASRRADEDSPHLDEYDLTKLARLGKNRIVVSVRSTNGVGGLLASIDIADAFDNFIVTDHSWHIFRRWNDLLPMRDAGIAETPMILGVPPIARWHFPPPRESTIDPPPVKVLAPAREISYIATVPSVKIVEGVAVATRESVRAVAYDFGFTRGRVRLTLVGDQPVPPVVRYRLANVEQEFRVVESAIYSTPFGAGEQVLTEPETRSFRYVIVFGERARADVVQ